MIAANNQRQVKSNVNILYTISQKDDSIYSEANKEYIEKLHTDEDHEYTDEEIAIITQIAQTPRIPISIINTGEEEDKTKIGYELSFTKHFYKPTQLRSLEEIEIEISDIEKEAQELLQGVFC